MKQQHKDSKKSKKNKYRKASEKLKKLGFEDDKDKKFTHLELRSIASGFKLRYIISLENALARSQDQSKEDKAHLLLKQETIEELVKELKWQRNTIRELRIAGKRNAKKYNTDFSKMYMEYAKTVDKYIKANEDLSKANQKLIKDINEVTRAYNGLHSMGKFAQEQGIDIKKYQRRLPEYGFSQKDTLFEGGKVRHEFNVTKKKKKNGAN